MKTKKTDEETNYPLRGGLTVTVSGPTCCGKSTAQLVIMRALEAAGYAVSGNDYGCPVNKEWQPKTGKPVKVTVITKFERAKS